MRVGPLPRIFAVLVLAQLCSCHIFHRGTNKNTCNDPQRYVRAQSIPPLRTPPGLNAPDTKGALHIPDLNQPPPPARTRADPCLDEPPSFVVPKPAKPPQA